MSDEIVIQHRDKIEIVTIGTQGPKGEPGNAQPAVYFNYGDATPAVIYTPSSNQVIKAVALIVVTPFDGVGATATIGTDANPQLLMAAADVNLSGPYSFEAFPDQTVAAGTPIKVFITPGAGATAGRAMVLIEYAPA